MSDWDDEGYDDSYTGRYGRLRSSGGAGSYSRDASDASADSGRRADADVARYSRSSYSSSSQGGTYRDRDAQAYSSRRYSRTDQGRSYEDRQGQAGRRLTDFPAAGRPGRTGAEPSEADGQPRRAASSARPSSRRSGDRRATASAAPRRADAGAADDFQPETAGRSRSSYSRTSSTYAAKKSNRSRKVRIAVIAIVAVVLVGAGAAFAYVHSISSNLNSGVDDDLRNALVQTDMANEPFYMLLLGTDKSQQREDDGDTDGIYRSDSMMLARIDPVNNKATLVSIPRDTLVDLGEHGWQKINAAYSFGGAPLAVKAVSGLAGVDISHYAEIDFDGFAAVVDALGGVEVEVPIDIDDPDAGGSLSAGLQVLNGEQALILARSRESYAETSAAPDLMRAANQRLVLSAIARKILSSDIATIASSVSAVSTYVTTDLGLNDIIGLAQAMQGLDPSDDIYTASFPTSSVYVQDGIAYPDAYTPTPVGSVDPSVLDGYYLLAEDDEWAAMKKRMVAGEPPSEGTVIDERTGTVIATAGADATIVVDKNCWIVLENGTNREGLATRAMGTLNAEGFSNTMLQDADASDYPETLVIYDDDSHRYGAEAIAQVLGNGRVVKNDGSYLLAGEFLVIIGEDWKSASSGSDSSGSASSGASASS